jgi:hypothetical protein
LSLEQEWNRSLDESVVGLIDFTLIAKEKWNFYVLKDKRMISIELY